MTYLSLLLCYIDTIFHSVAAADVNAHGIAVVAAAADGDGHHVPEERLLRVKIESDG